MRGTMLMLFLTSLSLTACATNGQDGDFCALAHPIYLDKQDRLTPVTARTILKHDETGRVMCGWNMV